MKTKIIYSIALILMVLITNIKAQVIDPTWSRDKFEEEQAYQLGTQAYIYGLAPWWSYMVIWGGQNQAYNGTTKPFNTWTGMTELANTKNSRNTLPNVNTLYASAWLDLKKEPIVLVIPNMSSNYFCIPLMDVYQNNFKILDTRSIGNFGGEYAICGPDYKGAIASNYKRIDAPQNFVWMVQRIAPATESPKDVSVAKDLQAKVIITPLSQVGNPNYDANTYNTKLDIGSPMSLKNNPLLWFSIINKFIQLAPGPIEETAYLEMFKPIHFGPTEEFDPLKLTPAQQKGLLRGMDAGKEMVMFNIKYGKKKLNGWNLQADNTGQYGFDFLERGGAMEQNIGVLSSEAAVYVVSYTDVENHDFDGNNEYQIHFSKTEIPQVDAFWSITLYELPSVLLFDNPLNRYQMGPQVEGMQYNQDGSLDIYLSNEQPKEKTKFTNWIPAPKGKFVIALRAYSPKADFRNLSSGNTNLPGAQKIK